MYFEDEKHCSALDDNSSPEALSPSRRLVLTLVAMPPRVSDHSSTQYHGCLTRPPVKWILGDVIFPQDTARCFGTAPREAAAVLCADRFAFSCSELWARGGSWCRPRALSSSLGGRGLSGAVVVLKYPKLRGVRNFAGRT